MIEALIDQKMERGTASAERKQVAGEINDYLAGDDQWLENFVLEASSEKGKFGGLTVLFSPYQVGAYAEGSYIATVPAAKLKPLLKADKAALFGGEPVLREDD